MLPAAWYVNSPATDCGSICRTVAADAPHLRKTSDPNGKEEI